MTEPDDEPLRRPSYAILRADLIGQAAPRIAAYTTPETAWEVAIRIADAVLPEDYVAALDAVDNDAGETLTFTIPLPWPRPPLRSNDRRHFRQQADIVANVRTSVMVLARAAKIPPGKHLTVQLHYAPGRDIRMDSHNLHPTVKACVDALARGKRKDWVGLELVPDDTDEFVTIRSPQIHPPPTGGPRCWLTVQVHR